MLDHVSVGVNNLDRSRRFYDAALRPLGLVRIVDFGRDRGSDYGAAPGSLGVEFTITKEAAIVEVCNEIAQSVKQMEGKQVNPALLSAVLDVLMQARALVDSDNESESYDLS